MLQQELVPNVDKEDNLLGVVERLEAYEKGLLHRGVHAFIQNEEGKFLIQQRSESKDAWPGLYDLSIAETLKPDETYKNALCRGLREELDLIVSEADFKVVKEKYYEEYFWEHFKIFGIVYLFLVPCSKEQHFLDGEVASVEWLTKEEVSQLVADESKCTPWLIRDWKYFVSSGAHQ